MTPAINDGDVRVYLGDNRQVLAGLPDGSVDCIVTSPPYWGLRDYGVDGQIGLEASPDVWVAELVAVFRECRRVLMDHGTFWLNVGDAYATGTNADRTATSTSGSHVPAGWSNRNAATRRHADGLKPKDLIGLPWMLAFALRADGWYLRSEIIWAKPNPMPESVRDRPTKAHEQVFLLTKQPRYWYDAEAIKDAGTGRTDVWPASKGRTTGDGFSKGHRAANGANARTVWSIATQPFPEAHFATFPLELPTRCIKAGCPERVCTVCGQPSDRIVSRPPRGDWNPRDSSDPAVARSTNGAGGSACSKLEQPKTVGWTDCGHGSWRTGVVFDPFHGSGTTSLAARNVGRHAVGVELNPEYVQIAARRLQQLSLIGGTA